MKTAKKASIAMFLGCGGSPLPPAVVSLPALDAAVPEPPGDTAPVLVFRATEISHATDKSPRVAWSSGAIVSCSGYAWCENDCFVTGGPPPAIDDKKTGKQMPLAFTISDPDSISMSSDCKRISFRDPSPPPSAIDARETWDVTTHTLLRKSSAWMVAGGAFDAELTASGNFLRWGYSRVRDRY